MIRAIGRAVMMATLLAGAGGAYGGGIILDQQLDADGKGYTVIRLWGSHYEMGHAHAELLGDAIVDGVNETKAFLGTQNYDIARGIMAGAVWMPPGVEDEFDGTVAALAVSHPSAGIDKLDLKVANTAGEWLYACRSHSCWGRYVAAPIKTLSTRRLDFPTLYETINHHVICARTADDGSPQWVNIGWPGTIAVATGVNEFGTIVSLHDYACQTDFAAGRMPRMIAARHALTFTNAPDVSTHLAAVYAELRNYQIMTGSFVNYYAPEGHGGVMVCHPNQTPDFYFMRTPQAAWHHGEAIMTSNAWTDGTTTPADEDFGADAYYDNESPKTLASHWNLLATDSNSLHLLSVAYRGRRDMTIWADGRLEDVGRTPRVELEWWQITGIGDVNCDGFTNNGDIDAFVRAITNPGSYAATYPNCLAAFADCNHDGEANNGDIDAFVTLLARP